MICLFAITIAIGCGGKNDANNTVTTECYSGSKSNEMVVQVMSDPGSLHPAIGLSGTRSLIIPFLNRALTTVDPVTETVAPVLAKQLPTISEDGLKHDFELREDVKWDDGTPVTAKDVLFSLKANLCPLVDNGAYRAYLGRIKECILDEQNPRKFSLTLDDYFINHEAFASNFFVIDQRLYDPENILEQFSIADLESGDEKISKNPALVKWAESFNGTDFAVNPELLERGLGPYKVSKWTEKQEVQLVKKDTYWARNSDHYLLTAYPDTITFKVAADDDAIIANFKQGNYDVATSLSTEAYLQLKENEQVNTEYDITTAPRNTYAYFGFNTNPDGLKHKKLFDDQKVRRAIAHLTPIKRIINEFYEGDLASPTSSPIYPGSEEYNKSLKPISYDVDKAIALLAEAGWKDTDGDEILDKEIDGKKVDFSFDLDYFGASEAVKGIVNLMQNELKKVGIECTPKNVSPAEMRQRLIAKDNDMFLSALSATVLPYNYEQVWSSKSVSNFTSFGTPETDELIEQSKKARDPETREKISKQLQEAIYEAQPCVFLFNYKLKLAIHKRFQNRDTYRSRPNLLMGNLELVRCE